MFLIVVPLVAFAVMQMRFNDHRLTRTGQGLISTQVAELAGRNIFSAFRYSLRAGPERLLALFRPSGYPDLETERRVAVTLLVIALGVLLAPFPYVALQARGLSVEESLGAVAFLGVTIYIIVVSACQLLLGRRSAGQQRLVDVLGTLSGIGVLAYWYGFFVLSR